MALSFVAVGAKVTAAITNAIITLVNAQGLTAIVPASVAGTGVTVSAGGKVSFTGTQSISINGCFSSTYENYMIVVATASAAASASLSLKMRLAGVDAATNYNINKSELNSGGAQTNTNLAAQTSAPFSRTGSGGGSTKAEMFAPALATATRVITLTTDADFFSSTSWVSHTTATAYDGLTITTTQNITGTIRVLGYNNS